MSNANEENRNSKRKRCKNFTEEEKQFLLILVKDFEDQIENKRKDLVTCKLKSDSWVQITEIYNKFAYQPREARQLRIFYENTKAKMKKLKEKFVHVFLCDTEKELLIVILKIMKRKNGQLNFADIQNEIWNDIHQQFNKVTTTRQVTLLQLFVYYKTHLAVVNKEAMDAMPYVTVTIKNEPEENNCKHNENINENSDKKTDSQNENSNKQSSSNVTNSSESDAYEDLLHSLQGFEHMDNMPANYLVDYIMRKHKMELEILKSKVEYSQIELKNRKEIMRLEVEKCKLQILCNLELEKKKKLQKDRINVSVKI